MANSNQSVESETNVEVDEMTTNANVSVKTNTINISSSVGRGRGCRTPTPPMGTLLRISPVDNTLGTVYSRLDALGSRLAAIESIREKVDIITENFNELLRARNVNNTDANLNRQNTDNEPAAVLRVNLASEGGVNMENPIPDYLSDYETDEINTNNLQLSKRREITSSRKGLYDSSGTFVSYQNSNVQRNSASVILSSEAGQRQNVPSCEGGSVGKETRRVHFQYKNYQSSHHNLSAESSRQPNVSIGVESNSLKNIPNRMIKLTVGHPLPNGQIVDENMLLTEQQYKQLTQSATSLLQNSTATEPRHARQNLMYSDASGRHSHSSVSYE